MNGTIIFEIKTQDYKYRVSIVPIETYVNDPKTFTRNRVITSYNVNLGGKNKCVSFSVPVNGETANLLMVKTVDGGCELSEKIVRGDKTIFLVHLGCELIREYFKDVKFIKLLDTSKFICSFPTGEGRTMDMSKYEILTKGSSYYESRYGARIIDDNEYAIYLNCLKNMNDETKKKSGFNFHNADLNDIFGPMYSESRTWREFIDKIKKDVGADLCYYMQPWYEHAIEEIFEYKRTSGFTWIFDIDSMPKINYKPMIVKTGGRSRTRKQSKCIHYSELPDFYDVVYERTYGPFKDPNSRSSKNGVKY